MFPHSRPIIVNTDDPKLTLLILLNELLVMPRKSNDNMCSILLTLTKLNTCILKGDKRQNHDSLGSGRGGGVGGWLKVYE